LNIVSRWHHRLNIKAGQTAQSGLGLYRLAPLLKKEAELLRQSIISDDLHRDVRRTDVEEKLNAAWDSYDAGEMSTSHFLTTVANIYRPSDDDNDDAMMDDD